MFTAETSNMTYSDINGAPANTSTQTLQQSVACAVNNLFAEDQGGSARCGNSRRDKSLSILPGSGW